MVPSTSFVAKYEVEKFDGVSSFSLWKIQMKSSLVLQGLWKTIVEDFSKSMKDSEKTDMKERALSAIFMSVTDNVLREIAIELTVASVWNKLEELYSAKSLTNHLYLKKKLYPLRMNEGTNNQSHLNEFNAIIIDLKNIEIDIEKEDKTLLLFCSLPPSYETIVDTLLYGKSSINVDDVSNALKSRELKKIFPDNKSEGETQSKNSSTKKF